MSLHQYVQAVSAAISRQDGRWQLSGVAYSTPDLWLYMSGLAAAAGAQLRELVAINNATAQQAVFQARQANPRWNPAHATTRGLPEAWSEFLVLHCACLAALQEGNRVQAYEKAVGALQPFLKVPARWQLHRHWLRVDISSRLQHFDVALYS